MGIAVATESLDAPVTHVPLLEPSQALVGPCGAHADAALLAVSLAIDAVAGADLRVGANGHAAGETDQLQLVEDGPIAFVVNDQRAKLPAHLLAPVVAGVLHKVADGGGLRIANKPLVVGPDDVACAVLCKA